MDYSGHSFLKTGVILAESQSLGIIPVDMDCEKVICSIGAISVAKCLRIIGGIPGSITK